MPLNGLQAYLVRVSVALRTLHQVLGSLSTVVAILGSGAFLGAVVTFLIRNFVLSVVLLLIFAVVVVGLRSAYHGIYDSVSARSDFYWESAKYTFREKDRAKGEMQQDIGLQLRTLRNNVEKLSVRFHWTGAGKMTIEVLSPGHEIMGSPTARIGWSYYDVGFGRPMMAYELVTVRIRQTILDPNSKAEPTLSKTLTEPIGKLTLQAFPETSRFPLIAYFHEYTDVFQQTLVSSREEHRETSGAVEWSIPHPKFGHYYGVRWGRRVPAMQVTVAD